MEAINRRTFFAQAALYSSMAWGTHLLANIASESKTQKQPLQRWKTAVGLNGFESVRSYGYKMDIREVLEFIKVCGFDGVELVDWPQPYPRNAAEAKGTNHGSLSTLLYVATIFLTASATRFRSAAGASTST